MATELNEESEMASCLPEWVSLKSLRSWDGLVRVLASSDLQPRYVSSEKATMNGADAS